MISYTRHAKDQMRDRSISKAEVEYCLKNYNVSWTDRKGNPIYIAHLPNGRRIKVVVKKKNPRVIITVGD